MDVKEEEIDIKHEPLEPDVEEEVCILFVNIKSFWGATNSIGRIHYLENGLNNEWYE